MLKSEEIGFEDILAKVNDFGRFKDVANCLCTSLVLVDLYLIFKGDLRELTVNYRSFMDYAMVVH